MWEWTQDSSIYVSNYILEESKYKSGIVVSRKGMSWSETVNGNFLVFEYYYINTSVNTYNNVFLGFYADFNVSSAAGGYYPGNDRIDLVDSINLGYIYDTISPNYVGAKILNTERSNGMLFIEDISKPENDIEYYNYISDLSTPTSGLNDENNYVLILTSGNYTLTPNDTILITLGVAAGVGLADLTSTAVRMQNVYDGLSGVEEEIAEINNIIMKISPNPAKNIVSCSFNLPHSSNFNVELIDIQGRVIESLGNYSAIAGVNNFSFDLSEFNQGIYFLNFSSSDFNLSKQVLLLK